jgi:hypothetical protein
MKYQLVLQWPATTIDDYDAMMCAEESLIKGLPNDSKVDGHDVGSGQVNIFIWTNTPRRTFGHVMQILKAVDSWDDVRAAYREVEGEEYVVLWPGNLRGFSVLEFPARCCAR